MKVCKEMILMLLLTGVTSFVGDAWTMMQPENTRSSQASAEHGLAGAFQSVVLVNDTSNDVTISKISLTVIHENGVYYGDVLSNPDVAMPTTLRAGDRLEFSDQHMGPLLDNPQPGFPIKTIMFNVYTPRPNSGGVFRDNVNRAPLPSSHSRCSLRPSGYGDQPYTISCHSS